MRAYGRDIREVMAWSMPQLRLMARYRDLRERNKRKWQLTLAAGMMSEEAVETLWEALEGDDEGEYTRVAPSGGGSGGTGVSTSSTGKMGQQRHAVDSKGNVRAAGAPLLSDIALGKAVAPQLIPIQRIDKSKPKEDDA